MNYLAALVFIVASLAVKGPVYGEEGKELNPDSWDSIKEKLQLSQDQLLRVREIRHRNGAEIAKLKKKFDQHIAELKNMLDQEPVDHQRIETMVQEIGKIQTDKVRLQAQSIFEIRSLLNPDQKRLLKSYQRGRKEGSFLWPDVSLEGSC
jgi:hypothetical protein